MDNLGYLLFKQGNEKEAEQWWSKSVEIDPKYDNAMDNLGERFEKQNNVKEAEKWRRKAIQAEPDNGLYHASPASLLFAADRKEEALIEAKKAQGLGLKQHPVYEKLGLKTP